MSTTSVRKSDVKGHPAYFKCSAFVVGLRGFLPSLDRGQLCPPQGFGLCKKFNMWLSAKCTGQHWLITGSCVQFLLCSDGTKPISSGFWGIT